MTGITCLSCGWVSYAVAKADAEAEIEGFNAFYDGLSPEGPRGYRGPSSLDRYRCPCGDGSAFRPSRPGDCPFGQTVNPVICDDLAF